MSDPADYTTPDFLDRLADQELANGNEINAAALRRAHDSWKCDREALREALRRELVVVEPLQARVHDLETRLAEIQRAIAA